MNPLPWGPIFINWEVFIFIELKNEHEIITYFYWLFNKHSRFWAILATSRRL